MKSIFLFCILLIISSASILSDERMNLTKLVSKTSSLRSIYRMSSNPQSNNNSWYWSIECGTYEVCTEDTGCKIYYLILN